MQDLRARALLVLSLCLCWWATGAQAVQVPLSPTAVIGVSAIYDSRFPAGRILDQQTGSVTDISGQTYWLNVNNSGATQTFITIDLGSATQLDQLVLFNTHNAQFFDRGTGNFVVRGANAVVDVGGGNFKVTGTTTVLVSGALAAVSTQVPPAQVFSVTDLGSYRYLSFEPTSVASSGTPSGPTAYGLNELRVFAAAVPEAPSAWSMLLGLPLVGLLAARRRRAALGH